METPTEQMDVTEKMLGEPPKKIAKKEDDANVTEKIEKVVAATPTPSNEKTTEAQTELIRAAPTMSLDRLLEAFRSAPLTAAERRAQERRAQLAAEVAWRHLINPHFRECNPLPESDDSDSDGGSMVYDD